jgi:sugar lactone lactonase YvrE
MTYAIDLLPIRSKLGESPVWDADNEALWFVDIRAPAVHRYDVASEALETWPMPEPCGSIGLCTSGRILVALKRSIQLLDPTSGKLEHLAHVEVDGPEGNRLNDGKVAPDGSFWVGSMDDRPEREPLACLYRVTPQGKVEKKVDGIVISNGLAWSADGRTMFHSDSRGIWIRRYRYDLQSGNISDMRVVAEPTLEQGRPDGAATDVDGFYWSAGVSSGVLNRWSPEGELVEQIALPVPNPTMPCFTGRDMKTVYVTSLERDPHPNAGGLVRLELKAAGVPVARFPR